MNSFGPEFEALAKEAECWITDPWAVHSILACEILTHRVVDPCCGTGVMSDIAAEHGYDVRAYDLHNWGGGIHGVDFLAETPLVPHHLKTTQMWAEVKGATVLMNPPFSLACLFVERALELGARKVVCFQRWAWWESAKRRDWWKTYTPQRLYACSDRATCWLVTVPLEQRVSSDHKSKKSTRTAHGWFVWERGQPAGPLIGHVSKEQGK